MYGIGIENSKIEMNLGTLWRSAYNFGASFIFTTGRRYKQQNSDTVKSWKQIPYYHYDDFDTFYAHGIPYAFQLIGIEIIPQAKSIVEFTHPQNAIYLLGAEDSGITKNALEKCHHIISIPSLHCLNVSATGSVVMYDRVLKDTRLHKKLIFNQNFSDSYKPKV